MALQTSGPISLNDMHVEAGGTTGTLATINDSDIRGLISKASGATMSFNEWYGASASIEFIGAVGTNSSPNTDFSGGTSYSVSMPSGVAVGDLCVVVYGGNRGEVNAYVEVGGDDPVAIYDTGASPTGNNPVFLLWYAFLDAAQVSNGTVSMHRISGTPQDPTLAAMFFRNVGSFPTQSTTNATGGSVPNVPVACDLAVVVYVDENNSGGSYSTPSGFTKAIEQPSTNASNHSVLYYKIDTIASGTSVGGLTPASNACASTLGFTL